MTRAQLRKGWAAAAGIVVIVMCASVMGCNGCKDPDIFDGSASLLNVTCVVLDTDETPSDGKVIAVLQSVYNGATVQLGSTMQVSCNGVLLTWNGLVFGHAERVPIQPVGGSYVFRVVHAGVTTTATVTVPARPVFAPPTITGAMLARTNSFAIQYVPGGGTSVRGGASDGTNSKNNSQPDTGVHGGLDVSGFIAGPGTLSITRTLEGTITGTGFQSAKSKYDTNKTIAITWL